MKNVTLTFILILFFLSSLSFAQYYVKFEGGYNLSINSMLIALNETFTSGTTIKYENVNGSLVEVSTFPELLGILSLPM